MLPGSCSHCCVLHCTPALLYTPLKMSPVNKINNNIFLKVNVGVTFCFQTTCLVFDKWHPPSHTLHHIFLMLNFDSALAWPMWCEIVWYKSCPSQNGEKDETTPKFKRFYSLSSVYSLHRCLQTVLLPKLWESLHFLKIYYFICFYQDNANGWMWIFFFFFYYCVILQQCWVNGVPEFNTLSTVINTCYDLKVIITTPRAK